MPVRSGSFSRKTAETEVSVEVRLAPSAIEVGTGMPFFDHLLRAMAFHGRIGLSVAARGDLEVDEHHLVEDTGLVLGEALHRVLESHGAVERFGHAVVPMDDALAEVALDMGGRPYLEFSALFPQERVGTFPVALIREFLRALALRAGMNVHAAVRYGENSHHMAEALFKALGVALGRALEPRRGAGGEPAGGMSTKGTIA